MAKTARRTFLKDYQFGFANEEKYFYREETGLNTGVVKSISAHKKENNYMKKIRLAALESYQNMPMPKWGGDLSKIDFDKLTYYIKPQKEKGRTWNEVPKDIKDTFDKLGVPQSEKRFLAGVGAQYESESVYHNLKKEWSDKGIIFEDTDTAFKKYPDIFKKYFGTVVSATDNKFAALNTAVWSGGTFIYVPKSVKMTIPLQNYFRINAKSMGQFERTLIIAEEGSSVHYIEGCTAPTNSLDSLHAAVVEIIAHKNSHIRYTTIQNWSNNVYNLVTKRAIAHEGATVEWIDGNLGSKLTMKYPAVYMVGKNAHADILSLAVASAGQDQDAGAKVVHLAPHTTSVITAKSISANGGKSSYRGLLQIAKRAKQSKSKVVCDALILDDQSSSDTYPTMKIQNNQSQVEHEATVSKIGEEQLFYLQSRGLNENDSNSLIVNGFLSPIIKQLPMEYAIELNRLIELQMEGSVG